MVVAWSVVALLLGDVWRLPHLLLSRHVVCREHGELVHDHGEAAAHAQSEASGGAAQAAAADPASHHHEHCFVVSTSARGAAVVTLGAAVVGPSAPGAVRELAPFDSVRGRPLAVLAYAPKHGPPV